MITDKHKHEHNTDPNLKSFEFSKLCSVVFNQKIPQALNLVRIPCNAQSTLTIL